VKDFVGLTLLVLVIAAYIGAFIIGNAIWGVIPETYQDRLNVIGIIVVIWWLMKMFHDQSMKKLAAIEARIATIEEKIKNG
jgi:hypothetical protein